MSRFCFRWKDVRGQASKQPLELADFLGNVVQEPVLFRWMVKKGRFLEPPQEIHQFEDVFPTGKGEFPLPC